MSDDLISRKDLKDHISELMLVYGGTEIDMAILNAIDNAPTVEYPKAITIKCDTEEDKQKLLSALRNARLEVYVEEERPQGEWLHPYVTDIACECSICHVQMPTYRFNFCPNCGAEMGKEAENDDS